MPKTDIARNRAGRRGVRKRRPVWQTVLWFGSIGEHLCIVKCKRWPIRKNGPGHSLRSRNGYLPGQWRISRITIAWKRNHWIRRSSVGSCGIWMPIVWRGSSMAKRIITTIWTGGNTGLWMRIWRIVIWLIESYNNGLLNKEKRRIIVKFVLCIR